MFLVQPTACLPSAVPVQCIMQKYLKWEAVRVTVTVRLKYFESRTFKSQSKEKPAVSISQFVCFGAG